MWQDGVIDHDEYVQGMSGRGKRASRHQVAVTVTVCGYQLSSAASAVAASMKRQARVHNYAVLVRLGM